MSVSSRESNSGGLGLVIAIVVALATATLGNVLLLGIPGALVYTLAEPLLPLFLGAGFRASMPPDAMWPLAIMLTLLWPVSIVVGYVVAYLALSARSKLTQHLAFFGIMYAWGLALSVWASGSALGRW